MYDFSRINMIFIQPDTERYNRSCFDRKIEYESRQEARILILKWLIGIVIAIIVLYSVFI